jgi:general secretion pathway protein G
MYAPVPPGAVCYDPLNLLPVTVADMSFARLPAGSPPARRAGGFTLIEIMVVVVILGILAALVAPNVIRRIDDARVTKAQQDIRAYETALNLYRMDNFRYPTTEQGLQALVTRPADPNIRNWKEGGYIDGLKKDPWGNDYAYIAPGTRGDYDLYTLGADGQPGGEGPDADIGNWTIEQ